MRKIFYIVIGAAILLSQPLMAQKSVTVSALGRGPVPFVYPFKFIGTYYLNSEEYLVSDLHYNGRLYKGVLLNINSHLDQLYLFMPEVSRTIELNKDFVDHFIMGNRKFVMIDGTYMELLHEGKYNLYLKHRKVYSEKVLTQPNHITGSNVERKFELETTCFLEVGGELNKFKTGSTLYRLIGLPKRDIKRELKRVTGGKIIEEKIDRFIQIVKIAENL